MNFDMADVRPTVLSFVTVGVMAVVFIVLFKYITARFPVLGLSDLAQSV
jgi:hypothetical protein